MSVLSLTQQRHFGFVQFAAVILLNDDATAAAIERALAGDRSALKELYLQNAPAVIRLCSAFSVLDADDVDDVVQDTFVRAFKSLARLQAPHLFRQWLLTIARNLTFTLMRRRARERRVREESQTPETSVEVVPESFRDEARAEVVRETIDALPFNRLTDAAKMFYVDGRPTAEIGRELGIGKSGVTMRLERFRAKAKPELTRRLLHLGLLTS